MEFKRIKKWLLRILIIIAIVSIGFNIYTLRTKNNTSIISDNIEEQLNKIAELSTIKYNYTDVVSYKDIKQFSGIDIPFTGKSFIVKYSGYLKAGVDFNSLDIDIINSEEVKIDMEKAKIIDNVIIEEELAIFNEKDGLFNKLNYDEFYDLLIKEKEKTEKEAIEDGILNEAENNAKEILELFLEELGFNQVEINII